MRDALHSDDFPAIGAPHPVAATPVTGTGTATDTPPTEDSAVAHHFRRARHIVDIKQVSHGALFGCIDVSADTKDYLDSFLHRHSKLKWMQAQRNYVQAAALAAAHAAMHPRIEDIDDELDSRWLNLVDKEEFNGLGFLKCGIKVRPRRGFPQTWICNQPEHCPRCNFCQRVLPAKQEFLPAFTLEPRWYSITVMCSSNPASAGVKLLHRHPTTRETDKEFIFRPSDYIQWPKLSKFGLGDPDLRPLIVADASHEFLNWLTDGKYFNGLHAFRDARLNFFPSRRSVTGVGHTANLHFHAYGPAGRIFTPKIAQRIWFGAAKLLRHLGGGELCAYPDIAFEPIESKEALDRVINYTVKPFRFFDWYLSGLRHGCPVKELNREFYQTAFGFEHVLPSNQYGMAFGNLNQKAGPYYIGDPPAVILSRQQVKRYLQRSTADELFGWEAVRYRKHLALLA